MKNKILLLVVFILTILEVISLKYHNQTNFSLEEKNKTITIKNTKTNEITNEDLEEYIIGVVGAEMPASFNEEALKAQAVASRTYAVYKINQSNNEYDVVTDISNQAYQTVEELKDKWKDDFGYYYNRIKEAVMDTQGEVMMYNDEVIIAYYFSMSNGYTEDASLVFNEQKPYLKSTDSLWEKDSLKNFTVTKTISKEDFLKTINANTIDISNIKRSDTNRVISLKINNQEYSGVEIRRLFNLRSTDFEIDILDNDVVFKTNGYGHGVGMSQYGANEMANIGYSYQEILKHYYQGIKITKM